MVHRVKLKSLHSLINQCISVNGGLAPLKKPPTVNGSMTAIMSAASGLNVTERNNPSPAIEKYVEANIIYIS